jgi:hypothetical protein
VGIVGSHAWIMNNSIFAKDTADGSSYQAAYSTVLIFFNLKVNLVKRLLNGHSVFDEDVFSDFRIVNPFGPEGTDFMDAELLALNLDDEEAAKLFI